MLTQDVLLDLFMVLCLAVVLGLGGTFLHRLATRRRSKLALRLSLLPHRRIRETFELLSRRESRE